MAETVKVSMAEVTGAQVLIGGDSEELQKDSKTSGNFYKAVRKMRKHPTIALSRELGIAPILAAQWSIEEMDNAPPGAAQFMEKTIIPLRTHLLRHSLFGCSDFGWQPFEKIFKKDETNGLVTIDKIKPLLHDITTIQVDQVTGAFNGLKNKGTIISLDDSLLVNIRVEGTNWYGGGFMEVAEKPYTEWNITNDASVRYDQKLAGAHWVIHYPVGKTMFNGTLTDNYEIALSIINKLQSSGCVAIPKVLRQTSDDMTGADDGWEIELKSAYPTANVAFIDKMKYSDAMMARSHCLPERAVLEGQFGTKAEAEAHADFAITNMELRHLDMVLCFNWHLVNQLLRINWGVEFENTVKISVAPITDINLQFLRATYTALSTNPEAVVSNNIDMLDLQDRLGIPTKSNDEIADDKGIDSQKIAASLLVDWLSGWKG